MKNVSEFTKTQALIDEYNKLKNKVPKLEAQMEQNKKRTEAKKEKNGWQTIERKTKIQHFTIFHESAKRALHHVSRKATAVK